MWPAIFLLPAGLLMFGFSIENHELKHSYVGATVGMAVSCKHSFHQTAFEVISPRIYLCRLRGADDHDPDYSM